MNVNSDGQLNVNVNRFSNDNVWNADNRNRIVVPKLLLFSRYTAGVFVCNPFFHPPSCRPISSSCFEISAYLSVGISLFSHASCMKNFRMSSFDIALQRIIIFCSGARYTDVKVSSRTLRNKFSIFCPMPSRSTLGKFL